mmetsp:Transcript_11144/g.29939  ORF Transcript_11144/g.29939 Transcript_11144/m.29939 type:complete len:231 (+) Transcript_11144:2465-3157(+)
MLPDTTSMSPAVSRSSDSFTPMRCILPYERYSCSNCSSVKSLNSGWLRINNKLSKCDGRAANCRRAAIPPIKVSNLRWESIISVRSTSYSVSSMCPPILSASKAFPCISNACVIADFVRTYENVIGSSASRCSRYRDAASYKLSASLSTKVLRSMNGSCNTVPTPRSIALSSTIFISMLYSSSSLAKTLLGHLVTNPNSSYGSSASFSSSAVLTSLESNCITRNCTSEVS